MIASASNGQVKNVVSLQQKSKVRRERMEFVVEGVRMVSETPADRLHQVYVSDGFARSNPKMVEKLAASCKGSCEVVIDRVFSQMSQTKTPQGILAVVGMKEYTLDDMLKAGTRQAGDFQPLLLCLENIQDPGNLGTILRTAEGAGVTGVIMSPGTVDVYNPKVIRSTMGSLYRVPFLYANEWQKTLGKLKEAGVRLFAAHLDGSEEYTEADYRGAAAFLMGNEGSGLTDDTTAKADVRVRIPMEGQVESLNAAIATAVLLFEAKRQRR
jgi:TrmH family RNA methyltransferase